ncbi:hypothetical protein [Ectobacillus panaciterrae]|nr:hypothetical protein [Ectobacillus panaciterrae]
MDYQEPFHRKTIGFVGHTMLEKHNIVQDPLHPAVSFVGFVRSFFATPYP